MSSPDDLVTELLTEHFRYTPISLLDDIINTINELVTKATDAVENGLLAQPPQNLGFKLPRPSAKSKSQNVSPEEHERAVAEVEAKARHEIENGVHQLETLLQATVDKNFDKMEIFAMRNIFSVPEELRDWVKLSHYEGLNFDPSPDAPTPESVQLLRRRYQESQRLQHLLLAEKRRNEALISSLQTILSPGPKAEPMDIDTETGEPAASLSADTEQPNLSFLLHNPFLRSAGTSTPLSTTTSFTLSQLPSLKSLLQQLRPQLAALSSEWELDNGQNVKQEEKSHRRQRLEYVEGQTRRYLENVRGLELGKQGEVRDGEWQGGGRKVGREEVEGLERIVGMVGSGEGVNAGEGNGKGKDGGGHGEIQ